MILNILYIHTEVRSGHIIFRFELSFFWKNIETYLRYTYAIESVPLSIPFNLTLGTFKLRLLNNPIPKKINKKTALNF